MLIRNNSNQDPRANCASNTVLGTDRVGNEFDIAHVKLKYLSLATKRKEWLAI
jgi:hypothetical protein